MIRPLNTIEYIVVKESNITLIPPNPADIPNSPQDMDPKVVQTCLTGEDLQRLWDCSIDDTVSKESRMTLYWHHKLRHAPLTQFKQLAKRRLSPKYILRIGKIPLCAACTFDKAHRRN